MWETRVRSLGWEDLLEKEMATHSSTLAWKIPWTEDPGRLQYMGLQSWTRLSNFTFFWASQVALLVKNSPANARDVRDAGLIAGQGRSPGGGHDNPVQYSCLEKPMDGGAWSATVHGVAKSQTRLSDFTHSLRLFCKGTGSLYNSNCSVQVPISQLSWSVLIVNIHPFAKQSQ